MTSNQETSSPAEPSFTAKDAGAGLAKTGNVVIIGMPASGKSVIGQIAAQLLGKGFIDLDQWIEDRAKASIQDIFSRSGEDGFRGLEAEAIAQLGNIRNHVISVGSGAVEQFENWKQLQKMGMTVYLLTTLDILAKRFARSARELEKRPWFQDLTLVEQESERLSQVTKRLEELYQRRRARFQEADVMVLNGLGSAEFVAQSLTTEVKKAMDKTVR